MIDGSHRALSVRRIALTLGAAAFLSCILPVAARAQRELLPVDHPATSTLLRLYELGAIPEFPREHLPISRGYALRLLDEAIAGRNVPEGLREQARYYRAELAVDIGETPAAAFIPTSDASRLIYDDPFAGHPIVILDHRDTALGLHVALEPLLDGDLRIDPGERKEKALIAQGGAQFRGTVLDRVGFSARITNGSIAGDTGIAARDPRVRCNGAFGVTAFGRDVSFGDGHIRADFDNLAVEVGREKVQVGGGAGRSLLLSSEVPCNFDYIRLTARFGRFSFSHIHASLLGEPTGKPSGPDAEIPSKFIAAHLFTFGPFAGIRASIGESVIYHGRPFEIGYLNPFVFMKTEEQYLRDRDNANMYLALSYAPVDRIFIEGELMLDDLRFSLIGDRFWGNKTAWRVAANATALPLDWIDLGIAYTRLEPYVFTHFNRLNNYTHADMPLAGGGLDPNSWLMEGKLTMTPLPGLWIRASAGFGEHGANIHGVNSSTGGDTLLFNAGGDIHQTRRTEDSQSVDFLSGNIEKLTRLRFEAEYEPLRNIYLRLIAFRHRAGDEDNTELQLGLRVGVH